MGRNGARACLSRQAKRGASKGASKETLAEGSKANGSSTRSVGEEGTKQSEQSSGWAQTSPACSQADETSSQAQCSTASTPTVAHRRKARQAKNLERATATIIRFLAAGTKSSEPRLTVAPSGHETRIGHSSWSYPKTPGAVWYRFRYRLSASSSPKSSN
jgi:hypothetical protein